MATTAEAPIALAATGVASADDLAECGAGPREERVTGPNMRPATLATVVRSRTAMLPEDDDHPALVRSRTAMLPEDDDHPVLLRSRTAMLPEDDGHPALLRSRTAMLPEDDDHPELLRSRTAMLPEDHSDELGWQIDASECDQKPQRRMSTLSGDSSLSTAVPSSTASESDTCAAHWSMVRSRTSMPPPLRRQRTAMLIDSDCFSDVEDAAAQCCEEPTSRSRRRRVRGWMSRVFKIAPDS